MLCAARGRQWARPERVLEGHGDLESTLRHRLRECVGEVPRLPLPLGDWGGGGRHLSKRVGAALGAEYFEDLPGRTCCESGWRNLELPTFRPPRAAPCARPVLAWPQRGAGWHARLLTRGAGRRLRGGEPASPAFRRCL